MAKTIRDNNQSSVFDELCPTFGGKETRYRSFLNFVYKMAFLASENAVFLNKKSDGRKYEKFGKCLNQLETKHLRFLDTHLVFKKALSVLQPQPFYTPKWLFLQGKTALFGEQNGSFWSVKRLSSQNKVIIFVIQNGSQAHFGLFVFSKKKKITA